MKTKTQKPRFKLVNRPPRIGDYAISKRKSEFPTLRAHPIEDDDDCLSVMTYQDLILERIE